MLCVDADVLMCSGVAHVCLCMSCSDAPCRHHITRDMEQSQSRDQTESGDIQCATAACVTRDDDIIRDHVHVGTEACTIHRAIDRSHAVYVATSHMLHL